MQTERLANCDQLPRLEYVSDQGEAPACSPLLSQTFSIGRIESADLQVDSNRVSRKHAVIERHEDRFRVRDLGSTNGTSLNGEQIEEAWLNDGDIVTIADTEFTFLTGELGLNGMKTEAISNNESGEVRLSGRELIASIRRLHESSFQLAFVIALRPLINLNNDAIDGWAISAEQDNVSCSVGTRAIVNESAAQPAARFRQLARVTAVKEFTKRRLAERLMFSIRPVELDDIALLRSHLERLTAEVPESFSLVATLPGQATYESSTIQPLRRVLDELGIGLAFESAVFNSKQLLEYAEARPSHVIVRSDSFLELSNRRPSRQQLSSLLATFADNGCQPIADGISEEDDPNVLRDLGFQLAFRNTDTQELTNSTVAETHQCEVEREPSDHAQSTQAEIAKVTARIRASWSKP